MNKHRQIMNLMRSIKLFPGQITWRAIAMSASWAGYVAMLMWAGSAGAQELELFEDIERISSGGDQRGGRDGVGNAASPAFAEPEFVLVGASRIGDRHRVVLTHRSGEIVSVPLAAEGRTAIPGHEQFRIVASAAGRIAIQYPAGRPCVEASDRGVGCDAAANIAWLSLRPAPAAEQFAVELGAGQEQEPDLAAQILDAREELARDPDNPFARLRAGALGQDMPPAPRFRPRRIDPSAVPPDMRVVSTPFGDRLVEID